MIQYLFDKNIIIYTFAVLCGLGFILRLIVNLVYKHLVKESDNLGETKNKMLKHIKMKFETCFRLKIGVNNVDTFVDKNVLRYRFCGLLLSTWENIGGQVLFLNLLLVPICAVFGVVYECGQDQILRMGAVGILTSAVLILVDKSINLTGKKRLLRLNLLDYLENFCKVRLEQEVSQPEMMEQFRREFLEAVESGKQVSAAAAAPVKEEPKDELIRRREERRKKEEEKKLQAAKREEEQRRLAEARREEEKRKQEERRQLAAKRREEERLRLEEEREALEARRAELKRKAEEKQLAIERKQKKDEVKEPAVHSAEAVKSEEEKTIEPKADTVAFKVEEREKEKEKEKEIEKEHPAAVNVLEQSEKVQTEKHQIEKSHTEKLQSDKQPEKLHTELEQAESSLTGKTKQQKIPAAFAKKQGVSPQEEKLIEDVLKEFFA